ncbi:hypothetical protein COCSUDRAFT_55142 [Coccomyxa subellipsoidea C-169]|uniref:t-SNARE coiled-coil homology domain-containing protein n=1 Tax=Coccomyxa subellipsoidea (strain C-169) TaxID=574566 RepID=I0Z8Z9_COCSC|nr:hypothetical protein COCSUDRAFT_55142 [Coccomyxa subellipsoidea C-169]EIE27118.1 hypothetical protein COCSUDRAFT_55142 [Coccomyxa subellipsoidea C-169]|eukprot:XP_005651662.1 hypothetical protein COCSUDRAFT_55142 [Coccomyxa subellipsoidea C-169]
MSTAGKYEQEAKLTAIYAELRDGFKKADGISDLNKQQSLLKDLTSKMQEAKVLIKEFEQEARTDGISAAELANRKKAMVQELNNFISMKKERSADLDARKELVAGGSPSKAPQTINEMSAQQLMERGRKEMKAQDESLLRAQKIVESTVDIGSKTAETLHAQGQQMERVLDNLEEMRFDIKKGGQVIRDITRGLATDKCIMMLLMFVVIIIVVIIACKLAGVGKVSIPQPNFGLELLQQ